jgi:23S rRNA (uracil1939-C5)-methyltransferase
MQIKIEKVVYPGKSLSIQNGKVIFTDEGLPDEIVEIEPLKTKSNYVEAKTIHTIKQSDKRVIPRCSHYKACSSYQYINYDYQLLIKEKQIKDDFTHHLGQELKNFKIKSSQNIWEYRNKLRLNVIWNNGTDTLAYHDPNYQNRFVPIDSCFLASEKINKLFIATINLVNEHKLQFIEEIEIKESKHSGELLLVLFGKQNIEHLRLNKHLASLKEDFPLAGIVYIEKKENRKKEIVILGKNYIEEEILNKKFHIGAQAFFQINIDMLQILIEDINQAVRLCNFGIIADLYCGIGTFGVILSGEAIKIIGAESSKENVYFLKKNIKINKIDNYDIYEGTSEDLTPKILEEKLNILIVDPPRKGLDRLMCQKLLKNCPKNIFYISCNLSTLIRDLKILLSKYKLVKMHGYDFFPHTPHIETFSILDRK